MSEVKVNKISPRTACGTVTLGDSGDTFTIPSGATITNAGTASGFGATGETSWDTTVKTTGTFTATAGVGYFLNTTGGVITVNLPAGAAGSSVALADYAGTWQTSNVTVAANGTEKIGGVDADVTLSTEGQSVTFVYIDGTQGWVNVLDSTSNVRGITPFVHATGGTITTSGDYKIHTFTGPGTFCVSSLSPSAPENAADWLVAAGGGGGGATRGAGGGGGGYRESPGTATGSYTASPIAGGAAVTVAVQGYPITVGGGGAGGPGIGANGNASSFATYPSAGGGYGKNAGSGAGGPGGSGGGGSGGAGGSGNTPPVSPAQGTGGGTGSCSGDYGAGGGGGATAAGAAGSGSAGGAGGGGATSCITGSPVARAGGGGGSIYTPGNTSGAGGAGGGGAGGTPGTPGGTAGTANTGGGGGGGFHPGSPEDGGAGGSGVVIIRYKFQ